MKKYQIIYADPPWRYELNTSPKTRAIENHYPTMELADIKALEVPADKDCVLYMWTTAPKLQEAFEVLESWGFKYRTCAIWDKETIGMGYWFRVQHEILLVATKGSPPAPEPGKRVRSIFREKKSGHSAKPPQVRKLIADTFPDKNKLELFARKPYALFETEDWKGWDVWGNQTEDCVALTSQGKEQIT